MEESIYKIIVSLVLEGEQGIREGNHTGVNVKWRPVLLETRGRTR